MFLNIKEMEVRRIQFDESFETGEIDFADTGLRQITPIHAVGSATLLDNTGGEIRVQGRYTGTLEADCDRCLALTRFPLEKSFDLFYRPPPDLDVDEIIRSRARRSDQRADPPGAADAEDLPRRMQGDLSRLRSQPQ